MAKVFLSVLLAAGVIGAFTQDVPKLPLRPEIRGIVLEPGSNQPVVEAEVTLEVYGATRPRLMPSPPKSTVTTKTDASGSFVFRPDNVGYFNIHATKDGYSPSQAFPGAPSSSQEVTLSAADPSRELRLFLSRPCQITGLVVDEETGRPIVDLRLAAVRKRAGAFPHYSEAGATTTAQGKFVVPNLPPGDYAIEVIPQKFPKERVLSTFSEHDVKVVDQDFEHTYWPGGRGVDTVSPISRVRRNCRRRGSTSEEDSVLPSACPISCMELRRG